MHKHGSVSFKIEKLTKKQKVKQKALGYSKTSKVEIICLTNILDEQQIVNLQKFKSSSKIVRRERIKTLSVFLIEVDDIPEFLKINNSSNRFFLHDSGIFDKDSFMI